MDKITIERETLKWAIRWHESRIWPGPDEVSVFGALRAALAQKAEPPSMPQGKSLALLDLDSVEHMQGGANGPTIRLRGFINAQTGPTAPQPPIDNAFVADGCEQFSPPAEPAPVPCCGKYETCSHACTPRGKWLGRREAERAALAAQPADAPHCKYCDGTGDVHGIDGEWRGRCTECNFAAQEPRTQKEKEQYAFEDWLASECPSGDVESVQRQWEESAEYLELQDATPAQPADAQPTGQSPCARHCEAPAFEGEIRRLKREATIKDSLTIRPPAPAAVPPGYVLVPIEPTPEMVDAGDVARHSVVTQARTSVIYRAMIAAAGDKP